MFPSHLQHSFITFLYWSLHFAINVGSGRVHDFSADYFFVLVCKSFRLSYEIRCCIL